MRMKFSADYSVGIASFNNINRCAIPKSRAGYIFVHTL